MIETTALNGMFILFSGIVVWAVWAGTRAYYKQEIIRIIRAHNARIRMYEHPNQNVRITYAGSRLDTDRK